MNDTMIITMVEGFLSSGYYATFEEVAELLDIYVGAGRISRESYTELMSMAKQKFGRA